MLGIIGLILKIILWLILGILGLLLLIILMVLLVPIRYTLGAEKYEHIRARGKVTYLFHLIRVYFNYHEKGYDYKVKVLFFTVASESVLNEVPEEKEDVKEEKDAKEEKEHIEKRTEEETAEKDREVDPRKVKEAVEKVESKADVSNKPSDDLVKDKPTSETKSAAKVNDTKSMVVKDKTKVQEERRSDQEVAKAPSKQKVQEKVQEKTEEKAQEKTKEKAQEKTQDKPKEEVQKKSKKKSKKKKSAGDEESTFDQVKRFIGFLREEENKGVLRYILKMLLKAIKSILPRKLSGNVRFGLEDPSTTGYIIGVASIFYPKYKDSFVLQADFYEVILEGQIQVKGKITFGVFVWYALRIIIDRRVRRLIKEVRK